MFASWWSMGLGVWLLYPAGYLVDPATGVTTPYVPREGDLIFYDDRHPVWTMLFTFAGSGPPLHMGIVVKRADGRLAVLEAGPDDTLRVERLDAVPRLHQFRRDFSGTVVIRRCRTGLDPRTSAALTKFAAAQDGKRYAVGRLLLQGTDFRVRGVLEPWLAGTYLDRDAWICSELAVAAGTVAGLFDPTTVKANTVYPRDLVDDARHDLSATWHAAAEWRSTGLTSRAARTRPVPAAARPRGGAAAESRAPRSDR